MNFFLENLGLSINKYIYFLGHMGLIGALSAELARRAGYTGRSLQTELERVKTLSQINLDQERTLRQRMENELEEAHQLQISILPDNIPVHPSAEIAWSMKTATEVGGDYYDYRISDSEKLTLILGDATGHGLQAGTLVTATKSLFQTMKIKCFSLGYLHYDANQYNRLADIKSLMRAFCTLLMPPIFQKF